MLIQVFKECGADVKSAPSASEGLAEVKAWKPNVIVSDIGMPDEDGYALMQQVRSWEEEQGMYTPAIALTAYARREDRLRALSAGFQTHLSKPAEPERAGYSGSKSGPPGKEILMIPGSAIGTITLRVINDHPNHCDDVQTRRSL